MKRESRRRDPRRVAREIDDELDFHIARRTAAYVAQGMSPRKARRLAERRLGSRAEIKSQGLSIFAGEPPRRGPRFELATTLEDFRIAARRLLREPFLVTVLIGVIALGIAANATIFAVFNAVVLEPLDFAEPHQLVRLETWDIEREQATGVSQPDAADWARSGTLSHVALFNTVDMRMIGGDEPRTLTGGSATVGFFDALGVVPVEGRLFTGEDISSGERVIVITEPLKESYFGGRNDVLGETLRLDGEVWSVVGVVPRLGFPFDTETYWIPWAYQEYAAPEHRGFRVFNALARLAAGTTIEQARRDLAGVAAAMATTLPETNEGLSVQVSPLQESMIGSRANDLALLFGSVSLLLLITCTNVAGLMLSRAARMRHEIALRGALGADRWRLVRYLASESGLLVVASGLLAIPLARWGISLFKIISPGVSRLEQAALNGEVALYTFALTSSVVLLTGTGSAWSASRPDIMQPLRAAAGAGGHRFRLRKLLLAAQTALTVVLLIGAGLLMRSVGNLAGTDFGFRPDDLLVAHVQPFAADYPEQALRDLFFEELLAGARRLPAVESATLATSIPQGPGFSLQTLRGLGDNPDDEITIERQRVTDGYFETLGIPLIAGGDFSPDMSAAAEPQIVVSESLARAMSPEDPRDALGRTVNLGDDRPWRVIGVTGDIRYALRREPRPTMYKHITQDRSAGLYVLMRTSVPPADVLPSFRAMLWDLDEDIPLDFAVPLSERISAAYSVDRFRLRVVAGFTLVAIVLSSLGLYGLMAYSVACRAREIGVRLALGAVGRAIAAMVIAEGLWVVGLGVVAGLAVAAALSRYFASFLHGLTATDPLTFALAPALLIVVTTAACMIPARRATRIDPVRALRAE